MPRVVTSAQVAPESVLISSTPPSKPSSKKYLCQKLSWVLGVSTKGGAKRRSSLTSSVLASLNQALLALCVPTAGRTCQVGLSGPRVLAAVAVVQPGFLSGSRVSLKLVTRGHVDALGVGVGLAVGEAVGEAVADAVADGEGVAEPHELSV